MPPLQLFYLLREALVLWQALLLLLVQLRDRLAKSPYAGLAQTIV